MDPVQALQPTLQTLLVELVSAQSAMNMPNPEECNPEMVRHAYNHVGEAVRQIGLMLEMSGKDLIEERIREGKKQGRLELDFSDWEVSLEHKNEIASEVSEQFTGRPMSGDIEVAAKAMVMNRLMLLYDQGYAKYVGDDPDLKRQFWAH